MKETKTEDLDKEVDAFTRRLIKAKVSKMGVIEVKRKEDNEFKIYVHSKSPKP